MTLSRLERTPKPLTPKPLTTGKVTSVANPFAVQEVRFSVHNMWQNTANHIDVVSFFFFFFETFQASF